MQCSEFFKLEAQAAACPAQTLTRTTSSDTILALAIGMLLAHLFLHDYRLRVSLTDRVTGAVSLATAIFASVVIASRLGSQLQVFSQVGDSKRCWPGKHEIGTIASSLRAI